MVVKPYIALRSLQNFEESHIKFAHCHDGLEVFHISFRMSNRVHKIREYYTTDNSRRLRHHHKSYYQATDCHTGGNQSPVAVLLGYEAEMVMSPVISGDTSSHGRFVIASLP